MHELVKNQSLSLLQLNQWRFNMNAIIVAVMLAVGFLIGMTTAMDVKCDIITWSSNNAKTD